MKALVEDPPQVTWLGRARWGDDPLPALHPMLSGALLDNIPARIAVFDTDYRYMYANRELLGFLQLSAEQVVGRHFAEVLGDAFYERCRPMLERVAAGEAVQVEGWVDHPIAGRRFLQQSLVPFAPDGGKTEAIAAFARDQTDLRLREQDLAMRQRELHASETLKASILDNALNAFVSTDAGGHIVEFNPAAEAMLGFRRDEVIGRPVSNVLIPERFRAAHQAGMRRIHAGDRPRVLGKMLELHALRRDGTEFPIEMVLWRSDVGDDVFYTASIVDVTERHKAVQQIERQREALRQSEKLTAMGTLLAGVAHELNNPLAILMGRANLLEEKTSDRAIQDELRRIRETANRCGRIVRTFLDMARSKPPQRSNVTLNDAVLAATDLLRYGYRTHGIALELVLADALPAIHADPDQIVQVVVNLLVNAQQALAGIAGERRVVVRTGVERSPVGGQPRVWLRVEDTGLGVPAELRSRIFEPFFTTKSSGLGTGLGLAMSRTLAREHGGDLVLEAESPRDGATFVLMLPISGEAERPMLARSLPHADAAASLRVLVLDDEPELTQLMCELLEGAGYEVATAESGTVALELLATARFDAIVSDLRMPDMDGAQFWRYVKARHPSLAGRTLFVTGDTLSPDVREFFGESGCARLDKPFSNGELISEVAQLLR
jgi:PAS domain S-box-containing protein